MRITLQFSLLQILKIVKFELQLHRFQPHWLYYTTMKLVDTTWNSYIKESHLFEMSLPCQKQHALLNQKDRWTLWTVFNNANYMWKILIWALKAWKAQNVIWESVYYLRKIKIVKHIVWLANSTHFIFYLRLTVCSFLFEK